MFEDPVSLDAATLIPQLAEAGVTALKIEGRQRSRAYTTAVVSGFRAALDAYAAGRPIAASALARADRGAEDDLRRLSQGVAVSLAWLRRRTFTLRPSAASLSRFASEGGANPSPACGRRCREAPDEGVRRDPISLR